MPDHKEHLIQYLARLRDPEYGQLVADEINKFDKQFKDLSLPDVLPDQLHQDVIETILQYQLVENNMSSLWVFMFMLGVFYARQDAVVLPTEIN